MKHVLYILLLLLTFNGFSSERPTITSYYEGVRFPYEKKPETEESSNNKKVSRTVSYKKKGVLGFEIIENEKQLTIQIDYNQGELFFIKAYKENVYQTGTYYFLMENQKINEFPTVIGNEKIDLDNDYEKRNCGSQLAVLNEILTLMEDLINSGGVDPESPIIGSLMQAAMHAFNQLMVCMRK